MKDTLLLLVSSIVDNTEKVSVEESLENDTILFTISVAKEDMGKLIGKEGRVIRAIRNVMKIPAIKQNKRISINIAENID